MRSYIILTMVLICVAAPASAWEWLTVDSTDLIITIAADSTDPGNTLTDSAVSPVTAVDQFQEIWYFLKVKRDTVFVNDSVHIELHAIDAQTAALSNIDTVVSTVSLDSLATILTRAGVLYEINYSDSTWYGYYYLLAIYRFDLGTAQADTNLAGNSYDCWIKTYGYGVKRD